jgi:hypothetical protein
MYEAQGWGIFDLDHLAHKLLDLGRPHVAGRPCDVFVNRVRSQQLVERCEIMAILSRHICFENGFS